MSKGAATTLILICSDRIARMDFGSAPSRDVLHSWQTARLSGQVMAQSVEAALASNPRGGKDVWILCEDVWTQTLTLPAPAVTGLSDQQLRPVLAFELESLSGMAAADSELGFLTCGQEAGTQMFWVTQVSRTDHQQIQQAIQNAGGRLRGICHPCGLPLPWQETSSQCPWCRLEAWGDITIGLTGEAQGPAQVRFFGGSPGQENWKQAVTEWLAGRDGQQAELLYRWRLPSDDLFEGMERLARLPDLQDQALERWLWLWGGVLASNSEPVPMVKPAARVVLRKTYVKAAVATLLGALAICLGHGYWVKQQIAAAVTETQRYDRPRQEVAELDRRIAAMEAELKQLAASQRKQSLADPAADLSRQKARMPALLEALSVLGSEDRVITRLRSQGHGGVTIEGLCLKPDAADSLAVGLGRELNSKAWEVRGAQKTARLASADGGPWEFQVMLSPQRNSAKPSSSAAKAVAPVAGAK